MVCHTFHSHARIILPWLRIFRIVKPTSIAISICGILQAWAVTIKCIYHFRTKYSPNDPKSDVIGNCKGVQIIRMIIDLVQFLESNSAIVGNIHHLILSEIICIKFFGGWQFEFCTNRVSLYIARYRPWFSTHDMWFWIKF